MKLLNDERLYLEDGEVKITMRPVTTSQQARLVDLASKAGTAARIDLAMYCLNGCIESICISGSDFNPATLAKRADISDADTLAVMLKLGEMVTDAAFAKVDDVKK